METKTLAEGKYLGLYESGTWEFAARPNSTGVVGILPITDDGQLVLVEQFRVPVQARVIEIPAGLVGDEAEFVHESLTGTARRELLEETGYSCAAIVPIGSGAPDPARFACHAYYFLATGCVETAATAWDHTEEMELIKLPLAEVKRMLFAGEIVDSVQQSALFYALHALGELG